jgi:rhodanese-related sulfurtransferase
VAGLSACNRDSTPKEAAVAPAPAVSGRLEAGLRVLTISDDTAANRQFTVYRGDYVRFETPGADTLALAIPALQVALSYPAAPGGKDHFKVTEAGQFPFTIGTYAGVIASVEFQATGYREVTAQEGAALIAELSPLVLDVRTPGEFAAGHLAGAKLIPVQVLQSEIAQLDAYRDRPVFVYCRSGNRSTVAAKMLMDRGFPTVINLRRGLTEWEQAGLPVTR